MFGADEKEVLKSVAHNNFKTHLSRNIIIFVAILLTALLLEGIISVGMVFYNAQKRYLDTSPGPGANGSAILGTKEQAEIIRKYEEVEWAAYVPECSTQTVENPVSMGCSVKLLAPDSIFYNNNYIELLTGDFPKNNKEILISDTYAGLLGMDKAIGNIVTLNVVLLENGNKVKKEIQFLICGVYKNPLASIKDIYEELYTDISFLGTFNPEIENRENRIYIKFRNSSNKQAVYEQLTLINKEIGGSGIIFKMQQENALLIVIAIGILLVVILLAAYLIIYNVFDSSLNNDIRYYGMLKALGSTKIQIRYILQYQVCRLIPSALCMGITFGYIAGCVIAPLILGLMDALERFYAPPPFFIPAVGVVFFTVLTVVLSCIKSLQKVNRISIVKTQYYVIARKKTKLFAITSFALSGIMFITFFTLLIGYDVNSNVEKRILSDFTLKNEIYSYEGNENDYRAIPFQMCGSLSELNFIKNMDILYAANNQPNTFGDNNNYHWMRARIKNEGVLKIDYLEAKKNEKTTERDLFQNDLRLSVIGRSSNNLKEEIARYKILSGSIDYDKFSTGNYIIYQPIGRFNESKGVKVGENLKITFFVNEIEGYMSKNFEVMALVKDISKYGAGISSNPDIMLLDKTFKEIYTDYENMIAGISIDTHISEFENYKQQQEKIKEVMEEYNCYQAITNSKYNLNIYFENLKMVMLLIGSFFSIFFGLIGIVNVVNSFSNQVLSKKIEYARMQALGMTSKQLVKKFWKSNLIFYLLGSLVATIISYFLVEILSKMDLFGGEYLRVYFLMAVLLVILVSTITSALTAIVLVKNLNKKCIVLRLSEIE